MDKMREPGPSAQAFDHIGARYDDEFTNTELSRWFRQRVWERLGVIYNPGDSVIEVWRLDFNEAASWNLPEQAFTGAYSNYGPLNCVGDWSAIGTQLTRAI